MTKEDIKMIDKFLIKIGKIKGEAHKNPNNGAFEVLIKKKDLLEEIGKFVKKMKEIQPEDK